MGPEVKQSMLPFMVYLGRMDKNSSCKDLFVSLPESLLFALFLRQAL